MPKRPRQIVWDLLSIAFQILWQLASPVFRMRPFRRLPISRKINTRNSLLKYVDRPLGVVDVGCRWGVDDIWNVLGDKTIVWAFDADEEECRHLASQSPRHLQREFVPVALGSEKKSAKLYLTRGPGSSSFYEPRQSLLETHSEVLQDIQIKGTEEIELTTLESWWKNSSFSSDYSIDVMKLDVQGAELDVLKGAKDLLSSQVRIVEAEVEFNTIYENQPLFADVDTYLRERGFVLWRLGDLCHYSLMGINKNFRIKDTFAFDAFRYRIAAQGGQLYWGQAYYVKEEIINGYVGSSTDWKQMLLDVSAISVYGWRDLATRVLMSLESSSAPEHVKTIARQSIQR